MIIKVKIKLMRHSKSRFNKLIYILRAYSIPEIMNKIFCLGKGILNNDQPNFNIEIDPDTLLAKKKWI